MDTIIHEKGAMQSRLVNVRWSNNWHSRSRVILMSQENMKVFPDDAI
jgi:hypothetical protein